MKRVRVVVDLPEWAAAAISTAPIPVEVCGDTVAERLEWLAVEFADGEISRQGREAKEKERDRLYKKIGVSRPRGDDEDDDISL